MKYVLLIVLTGLISCSGRNAKERSDALTDTIRSAGSAQLPPPGQSAVNVSNVIGWEDGALPVAPKGFVVTKYAELESPRWAYVLPNGDVLISQAKTRNSPDKITLLRDADKNGIPESKVAFLEGLNRPLGMLLIGNTFYVANMDGILTFPYNNGDTKLKSKGKKILDLPAGGYNHHWTRNIIANKDNSKIYVTVGSASNVGEYGMEEEHRRACILEIDPDGSGERLYAGGLRNPVGMDWEPETNVLWTAVNERDLLGDELVPDYATGVKDGGFYGWPYSYFGQHIDPRIKGKDQRPDLVKKAIVPDVNLGAHTASLGLAFYDQSIFPEKYRGGMFIGQHGSWNSSVLVGYKVVFIPFQNGRPSGPPEDFLTGFIASREKSEVYGRPVGVTVMPDGSMLVVDDAGGVVWRVAKSN